MDRDGVINELVFDEEDGVVRSPLSSNELKVFSYVPGVIREIQDMGFKVIVISNQPGVAKKQFTFSEFEKMKDKVRRTLARGKCSLDGEYYCLHSTSALIKKYKVNCECRKPKPGLLIQAASEQGIDLASSYFIGDGLVDVKAGKAAGCGTILISHMTDFLNQMMEREDAFPDYLVDSLKNVPKLLSEI